MQVLCCQVRHEGELEVQQRLGEVEAVATGAEGAEHVGGALGAQLVGEVFERRDHTIEEFSHVGVVILVDGARVARGLRELPRIYAIAVSVEDVECVDGHGRRRNKNGLVDFWRLSGQAGGSGR